MARSLLLILAATGVSACAGYPVVAFTDSAANEQQSRFFAPMYRFAVYDKRLAEFQYIGEADRDGRRLKRRFPTTEGPMPVDCENFVEFGVAVRNYRYKYDFRITDAWNEPIPARHFTYRRWLKRGSLSGQVRFRERPEDGVYKVVVTYRDFVIHEEMFRLDGCTDDSQPGTIKNLADRRGASSTPVPVTSAE